MCEFEIYFKKSFCCGFNLSNDDIISSVAKCRESWVWVRVNVVGKKSFPKKIKINKLKSKKL